MANGQVKNHSTHELWVVETDTGSAIAHRLAPGRQSPRSVDADGFRAVDGTPIDGHAEWVKIVDWSTADVANSGQQLTRGCHLCSSVGNNEFGNVRFDQSSGWGESISGFRINDARRRENPMSKESLLAKIQDLTNEMTNLPQSEARTRIEGVIGKLQLLVLTSLNDDGTLADSGVPKTGMNPNPIVYGDGYLICC